MSLRNLLLHTRLHNNKYIIHPTQVIPAKKVRLYTNTCHDVGNSGFLIVFLHRIVVSVKFCWSKILPL